MKKTVFFMLCICFLCLICLIGNSNSDSKQRTIPFWMSEEYHLENIESNIIKMTNKYTGEIRYHTSDVSPSLNETDPNIQVFDLMNTDTNLYKWKYKFKKKILVSAYGGMPMVFSDINNDGRVEITGSYMPRHIHKYYECALAEVYIDSTFEIKKVYTDSISQTLKLTDLDHDGLLELNFRRQNDINNYEAVHLDSFPDSLNIQHETWQMSRQLSSEIFRDFDNDGIMDVFYIGDDSLSPHGYKLFIAEYNALINNFEQKLRFSPPDWNVGGSSCGDFDMDGNLEFVTASIFGELYVFECAGDDSYKFTFHDTIPAVNAYLHAAFNDIDGNGKPELFVGGDGVYNGGDAFRVCWYEADGNNRYKEKRAFYLIGPDFFGFTFLYPYDVNMDGTEDLVFSFSNLVAILIWDKEMRVFELFYLDIWENWRQEINAVNIFDIFNSGSPDLFICLRDRGNYPGFFSNYYSSNHVTSIQPEAPQIPVNFNLYQNYPNPFNSQTNIKFKVNNFQKFSLVVYDPTGREICKIIDNKYYMPGTHLVSWNGRNNNGKEVASGVYLMELTGSTHRDVKKILLIK